MTVDRANVAETRLDMRRYWRALRLQKWKMAAFVLVVAVLTVIALQAAQPIYRASATLIIETEQPELLSFEGIRSPGSAGKEYLLTQFEVLYSRELAERAIRKLELDTHPYFDPRQQQPGFDWRQWLPLPEQEEAPASAEKLFDQVVKRFRAGLIISPVRNTQLVRVQYEHPDPQLAARIANTMVDVYIQSHLESKLLVTRQASSWLSDRLDGLRANLQASEDRLQAYREEAQLVDVDGVQTFDAEALEQLTQSYVRAKNERSQLSTLYQQIRSLGANPSVEQLLTIPSVLRHPMVQNLKQAQTLASRKVAELAKRYGPKHPLMIAALTDQQAAQEELQHQVSRVTQGIAHDYEAAVEAENNLDLLLADAKSRLQVVNRKEFKLREFEREVETNRHLYEMFLTRSKETGETLGMQAAHARIVDRAIAPLSPQKPNKKLILFFAVALSGMVGIATTLALDALRDTLCTPEDVERKLQVAMLGFVPEVKKNRSAYAYEGLLANHNGHFVESIRTIRTGLLLSCINSKRKVTAITSSVPNEGKSTLALNLAEAIGQMEKVLLVDTDMRRPTLAKSLDLPADAPGLSDVIRGSAEFKHCIHRLPGCDVHVLPSGTATNRPLELLSSRRFAQAMQKFSEHYDHVILDTAPTHVVSDALVLSRLSSAVIYVVKCHDTEESLVARGIKRLKDAGANIVGVVLSRVDMDGVGSYVTHYTDYQHTDAYLAKVEAPGAVVA